MQASNAYPANNAELFPWVLFVMNLIAFQCFMIPFLYTVRVRARVFNKEFMEQFRTEHTQAFPEDDGVLPPIGFPDTGNGWFSKKLSYKDWFEFNNAQRVHFNFLESLPLILVLLFITALKQPLAALIIGCIYFVSRLVYTLGYVIGGPNMRAFGGLPMGFSMLTLFGISIYSAAEYMKQYNVTTEL